MMKNKPEYSNIMKRLKNSAINLKKKNRRS